MKTLTQLAEQRFEMDIVPGARQAREASRAKRIARRYVRRIRQLEKERATIDRRIRPRIPSECWIIDLGAFLSENERTIRIYIVRQLVRRGFLPSRDIDTVVDEIVQNFAVICCERPPQDDPEKNTFGRILTAAISRLLGQWRTEARRRRILCGFNKNDERNARLATNGRSVRFHSAGFGSLSAWREYSDQLSYEEGQDNVALLYGLETKSILAKLADGWKLPALAHEMGMSLRTLERRLQLEREEMKSKIG